MVALSKKGPFGPRCSGIVKGPKKMTSCGPFRSRREKGVHNREREAGHDANGKREQESRAPNHGNRAKRFCPRQGWSRL